MPPTTVYEIPVPKLPPEVRVKGHLLGCTEDSKYNDHDLTDEKKFHHFKPDTYLKSEHDREVLLLVKWAKPIQRSTILNALRLPHFGRNPEINAVVKVLLFRVHGGYLSMDSMISLGPHLIARLTRLSKQGIDPASTFMGKTQDKQLTSTLKKKFNLNKMDQGFEIDSFNDKATNFSTQLLATKNMRKGWHNQVATHFIELGSQCTHITIYNWATFLQNEFVEDCREAQKKGTIFHYEWILIFIALEAWRPLENVVFPKVAMYDCCAVRYTNLEWNKNRN